MQQLLRSGITCTLLLLTLDVTVFGKQYQSRHSNSKMDKQNAGTRMRTFPNFLQQLSTDHLFSDPTWGRLRKSNPYTLPHSQWLAMFLQPIKHEAI